MADIDSNLELFAKLDEASGAPIVDSTGKNANGGLFGAYANVAGPRGGTAILFNGTTTRVVFVHNTILNPTTNGWTVAFWVKTTTLANTFIFTKVDPALASGYEVAINSGALQQIARGGGLTLNHNPGTPDFNDDKWHYVIGVYRYTGGQYYCTYYLDGVAVASNGPINGTPTANVEELQIGARRSAGYFAGALSRVRFYSRALTADDAAALHASEALVAHYPLQDNAASTTVTAAVGANGTLQGGDTTSALRTTGPGGQYPYALQFDGAADYVSLGSQTNTSNQTIALWANWDQINNRRPVQFGRALLDRTSDSGFAYWNVGLGAVAFTLPESARQSNKWYHYAFVQSNRTVQLFVNGELVETLAFGADAFVAANNSFLGVYNGASNFMDGAIADVRVYNAALTQAQVQAVMAEGERKLKGSQIGLGLRLGI